MRSVLVFLFAAGCYAPQPSAGAPCPDGACPSGLVCSPASHTCELRAVDAGRMDSPPPPLDAARDAAMADAAPNAPALQQQTTSYLAATASVSATLPATPTSGHVLVMIGGTPSGGLTSVTGGAATWTLAQRSLVNSNIEIWYAVADGSSSTVTISRTSNTTDMWIEVSEWSGLTTPVVLDGAVATSGLASPASAGSITTTGPTLVLFGVSNGSPNTFGSPTPGIWTLMTGISGADVQSEWYRVATSAGTFAPGVSETAHTWEAALVGFRYAP